MSAAHSLDDQREAEDYAVRAKRLATIFGWCQKCGNPQRNAEYCASCIEVMALEESIRRRVERNAGHECKACGGGGFLEGFFEPQPCATCATTGLNEAAREKQFRDYVVMARLMAQVAEVEGDGEGCELDPEEPEDWDR